MRPSSARTNNSLSRGTRPAHSINEDRAPFTSTSQSINLKNKNQAWPDIAANFSTEGSDFHGLRSPNNPNLHSNTFKDYRGRADRPVTFNETQSSPHMTSPTSGRFNLGSRDYSPHIKPNGREQYNIEYENNATTGPSESTGGGQRPNTQAKDYVKLEKEIIDLKNDIIGKMHNPKAAQRPVNKGGSRDSSSSSSSSEEANKPNPGRVTKKKVSYRDDVKGGGKQKDNSKIKIYDEEDVLVEEPEPSSTLTDTKLKEEERIIEKNVEGLGRALKRREKKYVDLKTKFKEMKTILKSYVNKVIDLEDTLKKKEEQLNNSEIQRKNDQKKLQKSNDLILELKSREEALQKSEGNAIDSSVEYKSRYLEQKEELRKLHVTLEETEETFTQKIHDLTHNNKELTAELEVAKGKELAWKEKNEGRYREIEALERELSTSKSLLERYEAERGERESQMKAIREELDKVRNEKDWLERKVEDTNKSRQDFESDLIKVKRKSEDEVKKILEDKDTELAIKKEKVKKLKDQLKEYEKIVNKGSEERKILDFEVEKVVGQKANVERDLNKTKEDLKAAHKEIAGLKTNLDSLKSQFNETYETLRLESTRSDNTQGEIKKLSKQLKIAETKLALRDKEVEKNDEKTAKLNNEVKSLLEETTRSRDYIGKLEDRVGFLQMHQSEEIAKVESRIEEFYREIYLLREENKVLKASEVALAKDIEMVSQERDIFRQDYKDMKQANKILEKELRSLNRNMKEVIDEKILEISHHSRGFSSAFDKDPKTEAIGEVQDMIKNYRHSSYKYDH